MIIPYGNGSIDIGFDEGSFTKVLSPVPSAALDDPENEFRRKIEPLRDILRRKNPGTAAVIVEDKTRKNPEYPAFLAMLRELLGSFALTTIYLIPAYGTHPKHSREEHVACYGGENVEAMTVVDHDSRNPAVLKQVGTLSSGRDVYINKYAAEADIIVTFGSVAPHTFAGFTGGRKGILPGIASYENIRENHAKIVDTEIGIGIMDRNRIHLEMVEAARLVSVDFTVQTVRNSRGEITGMFAGELESSFAEAVAHCRAVNTVVVDEEADMVFVGCGGVPKDRTLYHAQRSITSATQITKRGGLIVVFAEFAGGVGNPLYETWMQKPRQHVLSVRPEDIDIGVHSAYLTSRNLSKCEILFYTDMDDGLAGKLGLNKTKDENVVKERIARRFGTIRPVSYFIPNGSSVLVERR